MLYEFASWVFEFLDGSSNLEVLVSDLYDEGIHQFTASGNLAGPARKKHARFEISRSEQDSLYFTVSESGITQVYISLLWKQTFLSPTITLTSPDSRSITINGDKREHPLGDLVIISGKDISPKQTNRMDIIVKSETPFSGDFAFSLQNRRALAITIDSYIADNITQWMNGTQFQNHVTDDGTVCTPGTTEKDVTVGAYDPRGTRNTKGDINDFSSWGLTTDGRRALDITAPGTLVYSLTSHQAVGGHPGGYIDFGGTSAALPHVAGCAALIVQASPGISPEELANALYDGALVDEFTGQVPNPIWGYGKIRVYDSLVRSGIITSVNSSRAVLPTLFSVSTASPNPFNSRTSFSLSFRDVGNDPIIISVYNILGQKQYAQTIDLLQPGTTIFSWNGISTDGEKVSSGVYLFHFRYGDTAVTRRALYLK